MNITERQIQILEALSRYKYLTVKQISYIFGIKSESSNRLLLRRMNEIKKPLVQFKDFGVMPIHGKLSKVFFLTRYGKEFLINEIGYDENKIKYIQNRHSLFQRDYFHRIDTVNFNIYFQNWLKKENYELDFFNYYFDKEGSNRNGTGLIANTLFFGNYKIIPDGIGLFRTPKRSFLFLFEQHNGKDVKRAVNQILAHCVAISDGVASEKYKVQTSSRVFYVFENETCMNSTIRELSKIDSFEPFNEHFLFKTNETIGNDFFNGWKNTKKINKGFI